MLLMLYKKQSLGQLNWRGRTWTCYLGEQGAVRHRLSKKTQIGWWWMWDDLRRRL